MKTLLEYIKHFDSHLGISRKDMPQITKDNLQAFKNFLETNHISVTQKMLAPWRFKPSQTYIDTDKVDSQVKNLSSGNKGKLIVTSDNYILDGHHTWGAYMEIDPNKPVDVTYINAPIRKVIEVSKKFSGVEFRSA